MLTKDTLARLTDKQKVLLIAAVRFPQFPLFLDGGAVRHRYPGGESGPVEPYLAGDWTIRNAVEDHPNMRRFLDALCEEMNTPTVKAREFDYADLFALFIAPPDKVVDAYLLSHRDAERTLAGRRGLLPEAMAV